MCFPVAFCFHTGSVSDLTQACFPSCWPNCHVVCQGLEYIVFSSCCSVLSACVLHCDYSPDASCSRSLAPAFLHISPKPSVPPDFSSSSSPGLCWLGTVLLLWISVREGDDTAIFCPCLHWTVFKEDTLIWEIKRALGIFFCLEDQGPLNSSFLWEVTKQGSCEDPVCSVCNAEKAVFLQGVISGCSLTQGHIADCFLHITSPEFYCGL